MKLENQNQDKIEIVKQSEIQKQKVLIGKVKLHMGHKLFEFNLESKEIKPALFESQQINFTDVSKGLFEKKKNLIVKEECLYIGALNVANVKKVLKRNYGIIVE